ncbi:histone acetyltransferase type B catalytic subunit [Skeletonema marinoi]|uniref:Histone acetyltransferase type B catalytic subunit n=1 Tax=Skeletonema marinoi TaxID=267567 RepID=A0AAD8YGI1_9STRA|nr:histone acetyltransferase type B catalytic subunit [Skeletonema marinoi]
MSNDNDASWKDKEPVAGLSAASSCIRLSICLDDDGKPPPSRQFSPVYTHQCFPDEFISGWRPMSSAEQLSQQVYQRWRYGSVGEASASIEEKHSSYRKIDGEENQIDANVLLSPACDTCKIEVTTTSSSSPVSNINTDEPATKKAKIVTFEEADDGSTQQLSIDDVVKKIQSSLPPIASVTINGSSTATEGTKSDGKFKYLSLPVGVVVKSYRRKIKNGNDTVEEGDFDGGFWTVLYLFRKHEDKSSDDGISTFRYSLAGYITLFHFHTPFRKPKSGIIVRVCQALILPTYQRAGHGSDLLLSVHEYAARYLNDYASTSTGMDIVEVNVEDPAPGFVALRDSVDYKRFVLLLESMRDTIDKLPDLKYLQKYPVTSKEYFQPAPDGGLSLASLLKITKRQTEVMYEIYKLAAVAKWKHGSKDNAQIQQVETNYRLMIKKSLKSHRTEELGACEGGKEEQKALLAKWFDQTHITTENC